MQSFGSLKTGPAHPHPSSKGGTQETARHPWGEEQVGGALAGQAPSPEGGSSLQPEHSNPGSEMARRELNLQILWGAPEGPRTRLQQKLFEEETERLREETSQRGEETRPPRLRSGGRREEGAGLGGRREDGPAERTGSGGLAGSPARERKLSEPRKDNGHNRQRLTKVKSKVESKVESQPRWPGCPCCSSCRPQSPRSVGGPPGSPGPQEGGHAVKAQASGSPEFDSFSTAAGSEPTAPRASPCPL